MDKALYEVGLQQRKAVLGDAYVDKAIENADDFNREFQSLVTEYCWGAVWSQPVLDRKQRSLNNLCILSALNRPEEFKAHVRGAINNGCSVDEISETLIQVTVYIGVPAGVNAFKLASEVFKAEGVAVPD